MLQLEMNGGSRMQYLKEETRKRILIAALDEFKENGYLGASIRNIASNANIALGTVYKYFKNKEDLFNSIIEPVYNDLFTYINKIMETDVTHNEKLIEINNSILTIFERSSMELLILLGKSKGSQYEDFKSKIVGIVHDILHKEVYARFKVQSIVQDPFIFYVLSSNVVEGIHTILKTQEDGIIIRMLIDQLMFLTFNNLENSFIEMSHIY